MSQEKPYWEETKHGKLRNAMLSFTLAAAVLFASAVPARAIGYRAEDVYESVFVIFSGRSIGSGFAVGKNCVVTNAHVISDPRSVCVRSYSGEEYPAIIVAMDSAKDMAVLAVDGADFPYLSFADPASIRIGEDIYAIGAPKSMAYTLTKGVISAKERVIGSRTYIQIDAAVNAGNSGGPLLNDDGQVLGMTTLKLSDSEGIGLAIPAGVILSFLSAQGLEPDDSGNVSVIPPPETPQQEPPGEPEAPQIPRIPGITRAAFAAAGISLIGNVVLSILLIDQKKKNLVLPYDPAERTDFEIDIWE